MKIAFVTGGQPRFTPDFVDFLNQIKGVDQADIYAVFWKSDWADDEQTARKKIERILPSNWKLAEIRIVDEPNYEYPEGTPEIATPEPQNVAWWYKRCFNQCYSLALAADTISKEYDYIARFRVDCSLDRVIDFSNLNIRDAVLIPNNANAGWPDFPFVDQFFLGTPEHMMKFFSLGKEFDKWVQISDPNWFNDPLGSWRGEWLSGTFLKHHQIKTLKVNFNCRLNTYGRSRFTDKHYHHGIAPDPTEYIIWK